MNPYEIVEHGIVTNFERFEDNHFRSTSEDWLFRVLVAGMLWFAMVTL